ncbi:hypothetical protein GCM10011411_17030 [Aurantiacibacter arachoides]|nr:hypothetical protein GCM10011411_17030 [Aurantiacibacter arachoides]
MGVSARPLAVLPVRLHAEGRVFDGTGGAEIRAAAFAVTELPVAPLPGGFNGEVYAAAGYVAGDFATPFVDGQVRVTRTITQAGSFRLEAGGGSWGGAQRGTGRVDVGPTVAASFPIGSVNARLSADYRIRIAGNAEPADGPAITLSAGF